ncbi:triphosphoribosyl-dephospho-CoA synthase, partial [Lactobacillus sp. XV13L]|nr:triphosphoribosyl-dephospho-CoA synthase [Lactobacillus sp. XV13L]
MSKMSLSQLALQSLLYEVSVQPKPGLVDPVSSGPHFDMNVFTFIKSALSLQDYFQQCESLGYKFDQKDLTQLFQQVRFVGIKAEQQMLEATGGVNTHKGAVFSLGIAVSAKAYEQKHQHQDFSAIVQQMLQDLLKDDFQVSKLQQQAHLTAGQRLYLQYGLTGIRGEAQQGFPTVTKWALPFLKKSTGTINQRLLDTLMVILLHSQDTNLIKRAQTPQVIMWAQTQARQFLNLGGAKNPAGWQF